MSMDLKALREEKLKIKTREEFAHLLEVDVNCIKEWEDDPEHITFAVVEQIAQKTGLSLNEVTNYQPCKVEPLVVDNSWLKAAFTKKNLVDYIANALNNADLPEEHRNAYIDGLRQIILDKITKPRIAVVGRSDTGKSTLINTLLGVEKMPTSWTPTTSIAVYIKHVSDRPDFIKDDAWIFANQMGSERLWDVRRLNDEEYCKAWKIAGGEIELLRSYGIRQGDNYSKEAGAAVVFIDSPVLNTCDIIDLPGFGTETESDDNITFAAAQKAEAVIYLSQANGFMRIEDITYLKRNISELPIWEKKDSNTLRPLANLFIVASQAHTINNGNRSDLKMILDKGCENLVKTLDDDYWNARENISGYIYKKPDSNGYDMLRSRFFTYTTDIPDLCTVFNEQLKDVLEALPPIIDSQAKNAVRSYVNGRKPSLQNELQKYEGIIAQRDQYAALLREIDSNELKRIQENDERKNAVSMTITEKQAESKIEFRERIAQILDVDFLVQDIKEAKLKNKKEDIEQYTSKLQSKLQRQCEKILTEKSEAVSQKTADYVTAFSESITFLAQDLDIEINFDAGWAFGSALSKLGMIGGLGAFVVSAVSGAVFWGGALGFAFGILSAPLIAPLGLALGLVLAAGMGVVKLFGGGWEKSVAKKIISQFEDGHFADKFCEAMDSYWNETQAAFNKAADELDSSWQNYVEELRTLVNSDDITEAMSKIESLKNIEVFFDNIPL